MIKANGQLLKTQKEEAYGGSGVVFFNHIMEADKQEFYGKGRLFSVTTLPPGASIGYHVHEGEMECYYILSGSGKYNENNELITTLNEGDTAITLDGCGHSIENDTDKDLVFIAMILYTQAAP